MDTTKQEIDKANDFIHKISSMEVFDGLSLSEFNKTLTDFQPEGEKLSQKNIKDLKVYFKLDNGVNSESYSIIDLLDIDVSDVFCSAEPECTSSSCNNESQNFCDCGGIYDDCKIVSAHFTQPKEAKQHGSKEVSVEATQVFKDVIKRLGFANSKPDQMTNSDYFLCTITAMEEYSQQSKGSVTDEEIEHVACEESQQDWNDLRYKNVYKSAFIDGAKWMRDKLQGKK